LDEPDKPTCHGLGRRVPQIDLGGGTGQARAKLPCRLSWVLGTLTMNLVVGWSAAFLFMGIAAPCWASGSTENSPAFPSQWSLDDSSVAFRGTVVDILHFSSRRGTFLVVTTDDRLWGDIPDTLRLLCALELVGDYGTSYVKGHATGAWYKVSDQIVVIADPGRPALGHHVYVPAYVRFVRPGPDGVPVPFRQVAAEMPPTVQPPGILDGPYATWFNFADRSFERDGRSYEQLRHDIVEHLRLRPKRSSRFPPPAARSLQDLPESAGEPDSHPQHASPGVKP